MLQTAIAAVASSGMAQTKMRLGLIAGISPDPDAAIRRVHDLGCPTCQISVSATDDGTLTKLGDALRRYSVEATSAVFGGPGREIYNFYDGPLTIGLVMYGKANPVGRGGHTGAIHSGRARQRRLIPHRYPATWRRGPYWQGSR